VACLSGSGVQALAVSLAVEACPVVTVYRAGARRPEQIARIELEAALRPLVERAPGLSLAEEPRQTRPFVIWGLEGLQLRATG